MAGEKLPVMEIFGPTIQGEGSVIGCRTMFIRFGGCDFRCKMCDSMHAVDPVSVRANARWMMNFEILDALENLQINKTRVPWVTLSGGNPAMWDLSELNKMLQTAGYKVAVETQGSIYPTWLKHCDVITLSPKGRGMGERCQTHILDAMYADLLTHPGVCLKVVVFNQEDILLAEFLQERFPRWPLYLSVGNPILPGTEIDITDHRAMLLMNYHNILEWVEDSKLHDARILPQLHVLLWGNKQGV